MSDSGEVVRVLMVEDNPADAHLVRHMLRRAAPGGFELQHAATMHDGRHCLQADKFHVVLLDLGLSDTTGLTSVSEILRDHPEVPVVVLTGLDDTATALQAVRLGVQDYWLKTELEGKFLVRTIRYAIERHRLLRTLDETRQQQARLKEQFLSHVSHELRSPLTSVHQFASILLDGLGGPLTREQRRYVGIVLRNAVQLRSMIEELLDVARAESGKLGLDRGGIDVGDLIRDSVAEERPAAAAKSLSIRTEVPQLPLVYVDAGRISQVLLNLLDNAIKFTPARGSIAVTAQPAGDGQFICVTVSDTGYGIEPQSLPHIFDRLYQGGEATQSARKGLGLGLYICRELVARQGGRIWANSEVGKGTAVSFSVPMFSLDAFLQGLLIDERTLQTAIHLVSIDLEPKPQVARDSWDQARRQARWTIQRCVLPDRDVLIPFVGDCERRECVHVFAMADNSGVQVLTNRIRDQLLRRPEICAVLDFRLSAAEFRPRPCRPGLSLESRRKALADQLLHRILNRMRGKHACK